MEITDDLDQRVLSGGFTKEWEEKREIGREQNGNHLSNFAAKGRKKILWELMANAESRVEFYFFKIGEVISCLYDNGIIGTGVKTLIK